MLAITINIDEQVTYTAQSMDRAVMRSISRRREDCPFYLDAMNLNAEVMKATR